MSNIRSYNSGRYRGVQARRRGQALVEFALIATIFFTMLLGMIQFGMYQSTANSLWNLSREGARYAAIKSQPTDQNIIDRVKAACPPNIDSTKLTVSVYPKNARVSGSPVAVVVVYDMKSKIIFPLVGKLLSRPRTIPPQGAITDPTTLSDYEYFASSTMRAE